MRKNIVKGVVLAPLASGALNGLVMHNWGAMVFALVFAYPFALIIGLPVFLLLERNQRATLPKVVISGFLCGVFVGLFFATPGYPASAILISLLIFGLHGALVAFAFWLVALRTKDHVHAAA